MRSLVPPEVGGRASLGIFAGYVLRPGGLWSGRDLVWPLDDFVGADLSSTWSRSGDDAKKFRVPHETARVDIGEKGMVFPLSAAYDWWNETLEGRSSHQGARGPVQPPAAMIYGGCGPCPAGPS